MDQSEHALEIAKNNQLYAEISELLRKYNVHSAWLAWSNKELDGRNRTATIMKYGCPGCMSASVAIGVAELEGEEREIFSETFRDLVNGISKAQSMGPTVTDIN